ncbi:hypothetical protein K470DRAFT_272416 [Piedraia hortae CBS 480.64]|uniref:Uncharacterized protein n=1 Tax=Piedraia hortae CBS 480.64 TaxID=1314780 RepID=A0A6A7BUS6_9PEZI|nr:hypothetical protein K470DRAFT_272416 [Piedraia hortae CBS 480.64]
MSLGQTMTKRSFFDIFWPAFEKAFTKENVLSAWRKTGIFPFDPEVVLSKLPAARPVAAQSSEELSTSKRQLRLKVGKISRRADPETRKVLQELSQSALNTAARLTLAEHRCFNLEKSLALERRMRKRKSRLMEQVRGMEGYGGALFVVTGVLQKVRELEQQQADAKEREEQEKAQRVRERAEAKALKAAETLRKRQERQAAKDARMAAKARKKAEVAARKSAAQYKDDDDDDDNDYVEEWQLRRSTRQAISKNN